MKPANVMRPTLKLSKGEREAIRAQLIRLGIFKQ